MNLKFAYWYFNNALDKKFCKRIINHALKKQKLLGLVGEDKPKQVNKKYVDNLKKLRNSQVVWLTDSWIYEALHPLIDTANRNAGWNFNWKFSEKIQFTIYEKGQHYNWHRDSFPNPDKAGMIRKLSVTVQLNDSKDFKDGKLQFCMDDTRPDYERRIITCNESNRGSVIVFPSHLWHRVTPVTKGTRYSLVLWNRGSTFV